MAGSLYRLNTAYDLRVRWATQEVDHTDCTAKAKTQTFDFATALPVHAIVLGSHVDVTEAFTDGAAGTYTCDVGVKAVDVDVWLDGVDISTGIADLATPAGVNLPQCWPTAATPMVTIDSTVNLNTTTAGHLVASVAYVDPAQAE
jgi:hypothetical protein